MKRFSLQWRITLMSALLIGITCVAMNLLLCSSGVYYMDTIADSLQGGGAAVGITANVLERVSALVKAHVDVVVLDSAHGHSENVLRCVRRDDRTPGG